jgi:hypothetical protein
MCETYNDKGSQPQRMAHRTPGCHKLISLVLLIGSYIGSGAKIRLMLQHPGRVPLNLRHKVYVPYVNLRSTLETAYYHCHISPDHKLPSVVQSTEPLIQFSSTAAGSRFTKQIQTTFWTQQSTNTCAEPIQGASINIVNTAPMLPRARR